MSRTNNGGTRLRFISGLAAALAIAAGVFAAHGINHQNTVSCTLDGNRLATKAGGANMTLVCSGFDNVLEEFTVSASGSGLLPGGSLTKTGDELENGVSINSDSSLSSSVTGRKIQIRDGMSTLVAESQAIEVLKLDYTSFPSTVTKGQADLFVVGGLVNGTSYKWLVSDLTSWDGASSSGSGNGSTSGNAGVFNSVSGIFNATGFSSDNYYINSEPTISSNVSITLKDANSNVIDITPTFNVTN